MVSQTGLQPCANSSPCNMLQRNRFPFLDGRWCLLCCTGGFFLGGGSSREGPMWCGLPTDFAFTPLPFWPLPGLLLQYAVHVTYIHTRHTDGTHAYLVYIGAGQPTAFVHVAYTLAGVLAGGGSGSVGGGGFDTLSFVGGS